jgi:hypothetical protein
MTNSMRITLSTTIMCFISIALIACSPVTPHENAVLMMKDTIGKKWTEVSPYQFPSEKNLISSKKLSNGNVEKRYKTPRKCVLVFEIDPNTNVIVNASLEGKDTDCIVIP